MRGSRREPCVLKNCEFKMVASPPSRKRKGPHRAEPPQPCKLTRTIVQPDVLILEGLGFQPLSPPPRGTHEPDLLIYLDASEDDLLAWFLERFVRLWNDARNDPSSFYANFLHMAEPELLEFAQSVWERINLPNLRENIAPLKQRADIILFKTRDHTVTIAEDRLL